MARGSEEFYGNRNIERPELLTGTSPSEEAYRLAGQNISRFQDVNRDIKQRSIDSNVEKEKAFGDTFGNAIRSIPEAYQQARSAADTHAQSDLNQQMARQKMEQGSRDLARDAKFGDRAAEAKILSEEAGAAGQKLQNERTAQLTPLEVQKTSQDIANNDLYRKSTAAAIRGANLQNDTLEQQNKSAEVAAIIANATAGARSPQEAEQMAQAKIQDLKNHGHFDDTTLQKGLRLSKQEGMQDQAVANYNLQSSPAFQKAQEVTKRLQASASVVAGLKAELAKMENDKSLIDSPATEQSIENMANQLEAAGQNNLAASLRKNTLAAFMTPGEPTTKLERAKAAVKSFSDSISNEMSQAIALSPNNPHLSPGVLQPYLQAVSYNPRQRLQAPSIIPQAPMGGGMMPASAPGPGVGPGQFITPPGMAMPQQGQPQAPAQPPVDLFGAPGAKMKPTTQPMRK